MYVIREGLHRRWRFLAYWFAFFGLIGCLPALQANQLVQILRDVVFVGNGLLPDGGDHFTFNLSAGIGITLVTAFVIFGGLHRIAAVASSLVPLMTVLYVGAALVAILLDLDKVPDVVALIFRDAFTGEAVGGGAVLSVILYGVQRGAYSNEAGIGTEALAHGAARTREPIREGLVAMVGPIVDTLLICTATALLILVTGVWSGGDNGSGVTLTAAAFETALGTAGLVVVFLCAVCFAGTTILTYSFYGAQCASFLFGTRAQTPYRLFYVGFIVLASVVSVNAAISIIDGAFAMMAIPTMVSALLLAPRVKEAARAYFARLDHGASAPESASS